MTQANIYTVWQIATRDYHFSKSKHSSLTKATYDAIGNKFRALWGKEAGWAHSVLFTADLKSFSERLTVKTEKVEDVDGIVKREIKVEEIGGDGFGDAAEMVKSASEVKIEEDEAAGQVGGKKRKRKAMNQVVKSEFVLESGIDIKSEEKENENILDDGSMLDRVKRRRRAKRT